MTTDPIEPTMIERLSEPTVAAMLALGALGVGLLIGWKLAGGERYELDTTDENHHGTGLEAEIVAFDAGHQFGHYDKETNELVITEDTTGQVSE